ncbi:MAG: tRNA (adenosine(37)-N6)-threonylcarbamoyltransferase complex dimerization subunit type 1 TsaB [Eudoraea sp.]|nr:tRNA (adenosine(37)-N6)-threonylcarbamoyltransferase complex dimerization subunit type 1 TsaB [Eudoraea sp.]
MAVILNLETATTNCSVSVARDGQLLAIREENSKNYSHSEQLHLFIESVLQEAQLNRHDLEAVAVSKGPGSYTGLRIGVAAAKGLCFALDLPLISTPTLESLARQLHITEGYLIPMLDARRMEVYATVLDAQFETVRETRAEIITEDSFSDYSAKGKVYLMGSGAIKCKEVLSHPNIEFRDDLIPSAKEMAIMSHQRFTSGTFEDLAYFEPYYLKEFILGK